MGREEGKLTSSLIGFTLFLVTVTVVTGTVTDPVNVTKLFVLGGLSFAVLGSMSPKNCLEILKTSKWLSIALLSFLLASSFSLVASDAPAVQSIYGVFGRNNGLLLYLLLLMLFIATVTIQKVMQFKTILIGLFLAGAINLLYSYWVIAFGDFITWNNIYGNLLGTFGNPNFIGSFYGLFSGLIFTLFFAPETSGKLRLVYVLILSATLYAIVETKAVQGQILFIVSGGIVFYFWVRSRSRTILTPILYLSFSILALITGALGIFQKGPLSKILYKETVSLRGEYWSAGWNTGLENLSFGVGFDSFGDWYRRSRSESALTLPGVDIVTNAAHNVYLDLFAFGGLPLFLSYCALSLITLVSIVRVSLKRSHFDPIFVTLVCIWIGYQLQSVVSINQVGLAIWGWVSSGALIAYERIDRLLGIGSNDVISTKPRNKRLNHNTEFVSPGLRAVIAGVVGLIIAVPPLSADMKWRKMQINGQVSELEKALTPSYLNPLNSFRLAEAVQLLENSNLSDLAIVYARKGIAFNPDYYDAWRMLYYSTKATTEEKFLARSEMIRLDPLNPSLKELGI